jgi:hypothetical protein
VKANTIVHTATTLPNNALGNLVLEKTFEVRVAESLKALEADFTHGFQVHALCDGRMFELVTKTLKPSNLFIAIPEDPKKSMLYGRQQVIASASGLRCSPLVGNLDFCRRITFWREPEKTMAQFVSDIVEPIESGDADIVIPRRKSLDPYPTFSQSWERIISKMASRIIGGEPQDYCFGPRAFTVPAAEYFLNYPGPQTGLSDRHASIFCPLQDAKHAGLRIVGVEVDFQYPKEQRDAEENDIQTINKRIRVLEELYDTMYARQQWLTQAA